MLASLGVIVGTATLVWFVRPNRDSGDADGHVAHHDLPPARHTTTAAPRPTTTTTPSVVAP